MRSPCYIRIALILACFMAVPAACFAQAADGAFTNADVVKMMRAGLPESIIVREIRMSPTPLTATPAALIQLKKQGATEAILDAVLDSQGGPAAPEPYASA